MGALAGDGRRNQREAPHKRSKGEEPSTSGLGRKEGRKGSTVCYYHLGMRAQRGR